MQSKDSLHHHHHHPHDRGHDLPPWIQRPDCDQPKVLEWRSVSVEYERREILSGVDVWLHQNELTCICGANGAGKTQLVRVGLGLIKPRVGDVLLLGGHPKVTRHKVGYVPQLKNFNRSYGATAEEVLVAALRGSWPFWIRGAERDVVADALRQVDGLSLLHRDLKVLSGGEIQRVFLARAMIIEPELLILDEPMAGVDAKGRAGMFELLSEIRTKKSVTVVLITHNEALVSQLADRVIIMEGGRVVGWGLPEHVMSIDKLRQVAFFGHDHETAMASCEEG